MRQAILTVPMDGRFVILEDATGVRDIARWSTEAGGWVDEDGAPRKITPTYWYPFSPSSSQEAQTELVRMCFGGFDKQAALAEANPGNEQSARRRPAVSSMAAIFVGVALLGFLFVFRVELAAFATRYAHVDLARIATVTGDLTDALEGRNLTDVHNGQLVSAAALAAQLRVNKTSATRELGKAREALSSKASNEVAQVKRTADAAAAELRQSLQQERERAEALTRELGKAREEMKAREALSSKAGNEVAQIKQDADAAARERAEAMSRELESTRRIQARIAFERAANSLAALLARRRYSDH